MAHAYRELKALTDEQIEELHDQDHQHVNLGMAWYRDELHHRQEERRVNAIVRLTWALAGLTLLNTLIVAIALFVE